MRREKIEIRKIWAHGSLDPEDPVGLDEPYPPIIVAEADEDGEYELIDGYHRVAAAKYDGRRRIWAIIVSPEEYSRLESMREDEWIEWVQAMAEEA